MRYVKMRVVNRNGVTLLEVYKATAIGIDGRKGLVGVMYHWKGETWVGRGCGRMEDLYRKIRAVMIDSKSARVVGLLPEPVIKGGIRNGE
jgi:hypothetical protein